MNAPTGQGMLGKILKQNAARKVGVLRTNQFKTFDIEYEHLLHRQC